MDQRTRRWWASFAAFALVLVAIVARPGDGPPADDPSPAAAVPCPSGWTTNSPPARSGSRVEVLRDVAAVASDAVWAVGHTSDPLSASGQETAGRGLVMRWDGTTWHRSTTPRPTALASGATVADEGLFAVSGAAPHDVWALGSTDGQTYVMRWNGTAWTEVALPAATSALDLVATGVGQVWLAAEGTTAPFAPLLLRWTGAGWTSVPHAAPASANFSAIAASSANDVWVVGTKHQPAATFVVQRWDGTSWSLVDLQGEAPSTAWGLSDVAVGGPEDVWVLGRTPAPPGPSRPFGMHFDGTGWEFEEFQVLDPEGQPMSIDIRGIVALGQTEAIAVGSRDNSPGDEVDQFFHETPVVQRWNGQTWAADPLPSQPVNTTRALSAVAVEPDGVRWAVGDHMFGAYAAARCDPAPPAEAEDQVFRLAGDDRFETALAISRSIPAGSAVGAVISRSDGFADALAGTPLAARLDGATLLTPPGQPIDPRVRTELQRLFPEGKGFVAVLGGPAAVDERVVTALRADGHVVVRLAGATRYETAVAIARDGLDHPPTQLLATGRDFADALAAGAAAAHIPNGAAVLLTDGDVLGPATAAYLQEHPGTRYALGGPAARAAGSGATAIAGADRHATAELVADRFFPNPTHVVVAFGWNFPDALAGGPLAARFGAPLLLTDTEALPEVIGAYLAQHRVALRTGYVLGGTSVVTEATLRAIRDAMR